MGDGDGTIAGQSHSRLRDHRPLALQPDQLREVMKLFPQAVVGSVASASACLPENVHTIVIFFIIINFKFLNLIFAIYLIIFRIKIFVKFIMY